MRSKSTPRLLLGLGAAMLSSMSIAAAPAADHHPRHHAAAGQSPAAMGPAASLPAMQMRMNAIREARDPERRMALMQEQMQAFEMAMQKVAAGCPMAEGQAPGAMGAMNTDMMREHMQIMHKHMGMMQQMMGMPMEGMPMTPTQPAK